VINIKELQKSNITYGMVRNYQKEFNELIKKYIPESADLKIDAGVTGLGIPTDKLTEFENDLSYLNLKYVLKVYGVELNDDMSLIEINEYLVNFKKAFNLEDIQGISNLFTLMIQQFL